MCDNGSDDTFSLDEAAEELGMSRTLLHALNARGELPSAGDGRVRVQDVRDLAAARRRDRGELAERFAAQPATHAGAVDEVADLL